MNFRVVPAVAALSVAAAPAFAQRIVEKSVAKSSAVVTPAQVAPGGKATLVLTLQMKPRWHLYDPNPGDKFLTPTTFAPASAAGVGYGKPAFPAPITFNKARVHEGTVVIKIPLTVAKTAKPGAIAVGGGLHFQACNDSSCLPPATLNLSAPLKVGSR